MDYVHGRAIKMTVFEEDGRLWIYNDWYDPHVRAARRSAGCGRFGAMTVLDKALNRAYEALESLDDARQIAERGNLYLLARAIHIVRNVLEQGPHCSP